MSYLGSSKGNSETRKEEWEKFSIFLEEEGNSSKKCSIVRSLDFQFLSILIYLGIGWLGEKKEVHDLFNKIGFSIRK